MKFSIIKNNSQIVGETTMTEYIEMIKKPSPKVLEYRDLIGSNPAAAELRKRSMSAVTPAGLFKDKRSNETLMVYSGITCLDVDRKHNPGLDFINLKSELSKDKFVLSVHLSLSGSGVPIFVKVDSGAEMHPSAYTQVAEYIEHKYSIKVDPTCKDISRQRYISHDPTAYFNQNAKIFKVLDPDVFRQIIEQVEFTGNLLTPEPGSRNAYVFQLACNCARMGINEDDLVEFCINRFEASDFTASEIGRTIGSGYKKVNESGEDGDEESRLTATAILQNCNIATSQETPYLDTEIYQNLPNFFEDYGTIFKDRRQLDMVTLSSIVMFSATFPDVKGVHELKQVWSNLFLLIYAESGAGKGIVNIIPELMEILDEYIKNECLSLFKTHRSECVTCKNDPLCTDPPSPPKCKEGVFVSANLSSTSLIKTLSKGQVNLLHDSEADVLKLVIAQDWGSQLDPDLRKCYHHEDVSISRVDGDIKVKNPRLTILLTGTPEQARGLTKSIENGLASRLCTYSYQRDIAFKNQFPKESDIITSFIARRQKEVLKMYLHTKHYPFVFKITELQKEWHFAQFTEWDKKLDDRSFKSTLYRMGLVAFRIAMILTAVRRFYRAGKSEEEFCEDIDFNTAMSITGTLIDHGKVFHMFLKNTTPDKYQTLLNMLPDNFDRPEFIEVAMEVFNVEDRTAGKKLIYLQMRNLIKKDKHGKYSKI